MLGALLSSCATVPEPVAKPKLVVFLVVDGLPQRQITAYRDQLAPDGLARFLEQAQAGWREVELAGARTNNCTPSWSSRSRMVRESGVCGVRKRSLVDVHALGGTAEVEFFGNGDEIAQMSQLNHCRLAA